MKIAFTILVAVAAQLAVERVGHAYQLEPISQIFAPSGTQATRSYELVNDEKTRVALTISFTTVEVDRDHVETNRPADADFFVYPAQVVLAPGARQTVRVTWLGDPKPASELAYRIVIDQLPIEKLARHRERDDASGGIKVLVRYRGTLFITPPGAKPDLSIASGEIAPSRVLALTLRNRGSAAARIASCKVSVTIAGVVTELTTAELAPLVGSRVLAHHERRFAMPWHGTEKGPLAVTGQCALRP